MISMFLKDSRQFMIFSPNGFSMQYEDVFRDDARERFHSSFIFTYFLKRVFGVAFLGLRYITK